jgi:hypothetical protein
MTLKNINWLKNETLGLYLSGDHQENIANRLSISVGKVNTYVNKIINSDDTIELQLQFNLVSGQNQNSPIMAPE